ncbi:MAG: bis(5'-nucleosyl)-tetraphosphatase (symmetrical) YqeK [Coriobacteriales bacterium]|jgi:predicted HD superfamily hydrolase involved in NAD metabolism|nr:bis(5'-nucleosyl)-tetraphosphatase (symmetrical) YqeK [Coriobacteriales bacterium]
MIDADAFYKRARILLEQRLTEYRLLHSFSVADTAIAMAVHYDVNVDDARIAGLLHDWDKNLSDDELIARAQDFGIELLPRLEDMAALLHAQTGAVAVAREFPELPPQIIQAIRRHTSAAPDMSDLDMIIYIADMIEPLRSQGNLTSLRMLVGKIPLEMLFVKSFEMTMEHLIKRHRFIHPESLEVWNTYVARERGRLSI